MDAAGKTKSLLPPTGELGPRVSPDGKQLAVMLRSPKWDIKVYDLQRGTPTQITFNRAVSSFRPPGLPTWTPDSRHIVYRSGDSIQWIRADGAGESQIVVKDQSAPTPYSFSPDGKRLAYFAWAGETPDLFTIALDISDAEHPKPGKPEVFLQTPASEMHPAFSPNGRWIAYQSDDSGVSEIWVRPFSTSGRPAGKWKVSEGGGGFPVWSKAGRQLLYKKRDGVVMLVDYEETADSFHPRSTRPWPGIVSTGVDLGPHFDLAPDGKRLVIKGDFTERDERKVNLHATMMLNWFDEVRRRV